MAPIAERLAAQLLSGPPARSPEEVAERLLAIQGQDPRGARLAIRARTAGLSAHDVDRALTDDRTLLITWLNRGTLHLVRSEDYALLQAVTTPPLHAASARRLAQTGVSPRQAERAVTEIERTLATDGPKTRAELGERLRSKRIPTEGQALVHLLMLASLRGVCVRGPMAGKHHAYAHVESWLGRLPALDRERGLGELARRYLAGHAPASEHDLAKWAGLPLRDVRVGLALISDTLTVRADGLLSLRGGTGPAAPARPRLLGAFDPVLLGWASRAPILGEHDAKVVSGGLFRPFVLLRGRGAGLWTLKDGSVSLVPFGALSGRDSAALDADARDVERYLAATPLRRRRGASASPPGA